MCAHCSPIQCCRCACGCCCSCCGTAVRPQRGGSHEQYGSSQLAVLLSCGLVQHMQDRVIAGDRGIAGDRSFPYDSWGEHGGRASVYAMFRVCSVCARAQVLS